MSTHGIDAAPADSYDVYDLQDDESANSLGYDPGTRGLVVQRDGEWIADAADLDDAACLIAADLGSPVTLAEGSDGYTAAHRWVVR